MRVYLDHAATTPIRPEVVEAMTPFFTDLELMGNPSSLHALGRNAADILSSCHDRVAKIFKCQHDDVVFNSGGSEGNTHALIGAALLFDRPMHVTVSAIEHKAVLHAADRLFELGHRVTTIPVTRDGVAPLEAIEKLLKDDRPDLISLMAVNNEIGTIQPVAEVAQLCREQNVLLHTDAVQAVGHGLRNLLCDPSIPLLTISGHKFGAPRGTGLLIQRRLLIAELLDQSGSVVLPAIVCGGPQEHGCRAGTENIAGAAGLAKALELAESEERNEAAKMLVLREMLEREITKHFPNTATHGSASNRAPHITSVALVGYLARDLQKRLDRQGICIGLGSACIGCNTKVSHVLKAMQVESKVAESTLRFSIGWNTTNSCITSFRGELMRA